jgi:hypothetical protein
MTPSQPLLQRRLSGATLLLGGLLCTVGYVLMPTTSRDPAVIPAGWLVFGGSVLLLISLPWFHVGQASRTGALGWWATVTICAGIALSQLPASVLMLADRHYLDDDSNFHASAAGSAEFLGLIVLLVGVILMAVVTLRAGVYPRWAGWSLVAMVVLSLIVQFIPDLSTALRYPAEDFFLVALLGAAMLTTRTGEPAQQQVPVPAA